MRATQAGSTLASHQGSITERMEAGEPFGDVEDSINEIPDLKEDHKAALWLLAFSLRDRTQQQRDALAHLAAVR